MCVCWSLSLPGRPLGSNIDTPCEGNFIVSCYSGPEVTSLSLRNIGGSPSHKHMDSAMMFQVVIFTASIFVRLLALGALMDLKRNMILGSEKIWSNLWYLWSFVCFKSWKPSELILEFWKMLILVKFYKHCYCFYGNVNYLKSLLTVIGSFTTYV